MRGQRSSTQGGEPARMGGGGVSARCRPRDYRRGKGAAIGRSDRILSPSAMVTRRAACSANGGRRMYDSEADERAAEFFFSIFSKIQISVLAPEK